jgi:hypothetical protein
LIWERWRLAGVFFSAKPIPIHSPPGRQRSQDRHHRHFCFCLLAESMQP